MLSPQSLCYSCFFQRILGTPNDTIWPGVSDLPDYKSSFPQWGPQPLGDVIRNMDEVGLDVINVSGSGLLQNNSCQYAYSNA